MKRIISTLLTLLIPILISAQCWIEQGVQDMSNPDISSEFKALFKSENSEYADAYRLLHNQAFNLRNDVSILKKLNNTFEYVVNNLENVNEAFLRSNIVHLDLAGYNRYPEAVKLVSTKKLDDEVTDIENLLFGKIQDYTPKFKDASVDRITLENAPYTDDILAEINRITKDGASIELEHFSDLNIPYNEVADKVGGGIKKKETFIKSDYEYTRVTIIKGEQFIDDFTDYLTINGRVKKAGDKSSSFTSFSNIDNTNIPSKYLSDESRFNNLAKDPDQGNMIKAATRKEAMTGLEAEMQGIVNDLERGPKGIEFYDSESIPWDVKTPPGEHFYVNSIGNAIKKELTYAKTIDGFTHPPGKFVNPVTGEEKFKMILLDCTYISNDQLSSLRNWLKNELNEEELARIVEINVQL